MASYRNTVCVDFHDRKHKLVILKTYMPKGSKEEFISSVSVQSKDVNLSQFGVRKIYYAYGLGDLFDLPGTRLRVDVNELLHGRWNTEVLPFVCGSIEGEQIMQDDMMMRLVQVTTYGGQGAVDDVLNSGRYRKATEAEMSQFSKKNDYDDRQGRNNRKPKKNHNQLSRSGSEHTTNSSSNESTPSHTVAHAQARRSYSDSGVTPTHSGVKSSTLPVGLSHLNAENMTQRQSTELTNVIANTVSISEPLNRVRSGTDANDSITKSKSQQKRERRKAKANVGGASGPVSDMTPTRIVNGQVVETISSQPELTGNKMGGETHKGVALAQQKRTNAVTSNSKPGISGELQPKVKTKKAAPTPPLSLNAGGDAIKSEQIFAAGKARGGFTADEVATLKTRGLYHESMPIYVAPPEGAWGEAELSGSEIDDDPSALVEKSGEYDLENEYASTSDHE